MTRAASGSATRFKSLDAAALPVASDELALLVRLREAGLPIVDTWLVPCDPRAVGGVLRELGNEPAVVAAPLVPNAVLLVDPIFDEPLGREATQAERELRAAKWVDVASGRFGAPWLRVQARATTRGFASSVDSRTGDPDVVSAWSVGEEPVVVDRRTMRQLSGATGPLEPGLVARISDLVDRAQLVLGRPVEIEWCAAGSRAEVIWVRNARVTPAFTEHSYRRLALVAADEGTVAPLAIDVMDKALGLGDATVDGPRVRRVYARPYRRTDSTRLAVVPTRSPLARAAVRSAQTAADAAAPLRAVRALAPSINETLRTRRGVRLEGLDHRALVAELHASESLAVAALALLERLRVASTAAIAAIEAVIGTIDRASYIALVAPRATDERRAIDDALVVVASELAQNGDRGTPGSAADSVVARAKARLRGKRSLGLDVTPPSYDERPDVLVDAAKRVREQHYLVVEARRTEAERRLRDAVRTLTVGTVRLGIASGLLAVLSRLADAKGEVSELLADALLTLRRVGCEAGRRLADASVLDAPDDALYLDPSEIEEALIGEPGAYAARVRLRREDEERWREFEAPRRLHANEHAVVRDRES